MEKAGVPNPVFSGIHSCTLPSLVPTQEPEVLGKDMYLIRPRLCLHSFYTESKIETQGL